MRSINIIFLSLVLISSCSLLPSAPAPSDSDDEFDIPLVPKHKILKHLKNYKADLKAFIKNSPYKQQLQEVQKAYFRTEKLSACVIDVEQYVDNLNQQGANLAHIDINNKQVKLFSDLHTEENKKYKQCCHALTGNVHQLWNLFSLTEYRQFIYEQSALLLRAQNEELLQRQQAMQHQINQLQAVIVQYNPRFKLQRDDAPNQIQSNNRQY